MEQPRSNRRLLDISLSQFRSARACLSRLALNAPRPLQHMARSSEAAGAGAITSTMVNPSCHTRRAYAAPPLSVITVCSASLTRAPSASHCHVRRPLCHGCPCQELQKMQQHCYQLAASAMGPCRDCSCALNGDRRGHALKRCLHFFWLREVGHSFSAGVLHQNLSFLSKRQTCSHCSSMACILPWGLQTCKHRLVVLICAAHHPLRRLCRHHAPRQLAMGHRRFQTSGASAVQIS